MFRLSVEELAFAMGFLGGSDVAAGFLEATIGKQNKDNVSGRITAASHSLLARELLALDLDENTNELHADLATLVKIMLSTEMSVRCQSLVDGQESILTCFMSNGEMVAHDLEVGVIARLEKLNDITQLKNRIEQFIQPPTVENISDPVGRLSGDMLQNVRQLIAQKEIVKVQNILEESFPKTVAHTLVDDLQHDDIVWGTILLLETSKNSETPLESNEGILYAANPDTLWLFQFVSDDTANVTVFKGNTGQLDLLLDRMLSKL